LPEKPLSVALGGSAEPIFGEFFTQFPSAAEFAHPILFTNPCMSRGTEYFLAQARNLEMAKAAAPKKALTKTELYANIATATDLTKKQVAAVVDALAAEIKKSLGNKGPGLFALPGLLKIEKKRVPARAAQMGVPNPFKPGELMDRAAKPAYNKIKVRALKNLKDMAK
jgi:nucleoid DNA-binding protein